MPRLTEIEPEDADAFTRKLYNRVGMVPNLYIQMANSAMVFDGFLKLNACLEGSKLEKKIREMVYLRTSQINGCVYCQASHTSTAVEHGILTQQETLDARRGRSDDPRIEAMLVFTTAVVTDRGHVTDELLERVRAQGFSDEEIVDAIGTMGMATLSNYIAIVGQPDLDFLDAPELDEEASANRRPPVSPSA
jgi:uncharacterized peroxidase-related enzyme